MESRLLLSSNQPTGVLDDSIWNLDSLQTNYAIISAGDKLDVAPTNTRSITNTAGAPLDTAWGGGFSLNTDSTSAPVLVLGIRPNNPATTIGNFTNSLGHNGFFATDDANSFPSRPNNVDFNLSGTLQIRLHADFDVSGSGVIALIDSVDSPSSLGKILVAQPIPRTALILDPLQSGESLSLNTPLTGAGTLANPADTINTIFAPIERDPLTESLWNGTLTGAPVADFAPLEIITTVAIPGAATLTWQTVHSALEKISPIDTEHDRVVEFKSDELTASDTLVQQVAPIPTTGNLAVRPAPTRQTKSDENLSDAIDSLLSEDTILIGQNGDGTTNQVAEATTKDAQAQLLAEGGMISVEQIVGAMSSDSVTLASAGTQIATVNQPTDLVGELSRVAVMELIEGEPEPAAPEATGHVVLLADGASSYHVTLDTVRLIAEQANQAVAAVSPVSPAYLTSFASAASHAFAAVVNSELSAQLSDAARNEAFSEWGDEDSDQLDSDQTASTADRESNGWLDAAPLVVALACERALAAKKKRRQREPDRKPVKAK